MWGEKGKEVGERKSREDRVRKARLIRIRGVRVLTKAGGAIYRGRKDSGVSSVCI